MRKQSFAYSVACAFGELLAFAGPVKPYPVANADEITRSAWTNTGNAIRSGMHTVDKTLTDEQRQLICR